MRFWVGRHLWRRVAGSAYGRVMRLDKPIGTYLLYAPCAWSIALSSEAGTLVDRPDLLLSFGAGAVLLRGAACTVNDWWDRDIDRLVARTAMRPIASGEISPTAGIAFAAGQALAGLPILLSLNHPSVIMGVVSLVPVGLYPLAKRVSHWPQAVLGLTINWGAMMGWVAVTGSLDPPALALYGASWAWTMVYDTIYAHQDLADDCRVGVGSTAQRFAGAPHAWLGAFAALFGAGLVAAGALAGQSAPYYAGTAVATGMVARQAVATPLGNPKACLAAFKANGWVGVVVFAGICAGNVADPVS